MRERFSNRSLTSGFTIKSHTFRLFNSTAIRARDKPFSSTWFRARSVVSPVPAGRQHGRTIYHCQSRSLR